MSETTARRLKLQCEAVLNSFLTFERGREYSSHDADDMPADLRADLEDYGWDGEAWTYDDFLNEAGDALSLTWKKGEPLQVLFCCGGPNVYLTYDPIEGAAIEGYWGGDRYALIGPDVDRMAAHWRELAELLTLD